MGAGVRDLFRQHRDDRGAADVGAPPGDLAVRVEHDTIGRCIAPREPGLPRIGLVRVIGVSLAFGEFLTGHAADEPGIAERGLRGPAAAVGDRTEAISIDAVRAAPGQSGIFTRLSAGAHSNSAVLGSLTVARIFRRTNSDAVSLDCLLTNKSVNEYRKLILPPSAHFASYARSRSSSVAAHW
jgi:hypothetical protein